MALLAVVLGKACSKHAKWMNFQQSLEVYSAIIGKTYLPQKILLTDFCSATFASFSLFLNKLPFAFWYELQRH